jgi:hypothetical protein
MNPKIIKLYYKKLDKPTNLNGLILHPFLQEDRIIWKYENPNNVSFSTDVVTGHLEGLLYDFLKSIGVENHPGSPNIDWKVLSSKYCRLDDSDVYINDEIRNEINRIVDGFKTITLDDDSDELISECFVKDWSISYPDSEALYFHLDLELSNPKINNKPVDDDTLQEFIQSFIYCDTVSEQETDFIWEIVKLLLKQKNLFDEDYMYVNAVIGYYDSFGNGLT